MAPHRLLLVEDTRSDELLTLDALASGGLAGAAVVVRDGAAALDYVFRRGAHAAGAEPIQVVLLDLGLPKVGGLQVLRELRARPETRSLPVVVLTSSAEDRDVVESYQLGANSFVQKPVEFEDFRRAVRELGQYWMRLNHPVPQ